MPRTLEAERANGVAATPSVDRTAVVADATIRLARARIANPHDRQPLIDIITETETGRELNGLARTLASSNELYAKSIVRWTVMAELKRIKP